MSESKLRKKSVAKSFLAIALLISGQISLFAQGTEVDFNTIPKSGTILIYAHMDDDLIWMLPFWIKSEKFIGGAMPATTSYRTIISQQQTFLNNNGYNIDYQYNWYTPWDDVTEIEYTEYYLRANSSYDYLLSDHLETRLGSSTVPMSTFEINKIKAKIEQYFADPSMSRVITHNNWGEYGHQHHRSINKAVRELAVKYRKDVWMLGCDNGNFVDVTVPNGITYSYGSFNQPDLYLGIRTIYENNYRWTWNSTVTPSGDHKFIEIVEEGSDKSNILMGNEITYPGPSQLEPGAYIFDGDDDYLTLKGNNNSSFTIAMRIHPDQIREMDISAMSEYPLSSKNDRNLYVTNDGHITARIFDGSSKVLTSRATIQAGLWTHIAITSNGSSFKLYVNGVLDKAITAGSAITDYSTPEFILGLASETGSNFSGQISDVRSYNYVMSDADIAVLSGMVLNIVSSSGMGGTIEPSGNISVVAGTDKTFTIIPGTGYKISDVQVDNSSHGAVSTFTFTNILGDHTITAEFSSTPTYTISSSTGTGGSISPSGVLVLNEGSNQTYNITAGIGYLVSDLVVDGVSVGAYSTYTFSNITANHTISASFVATPTFTITASSGTGGSVTPSGLTTVNEGSNETFAITPNTGYHISDVLADEISVGSVASYTFSNVTANHTITASFSLNTYTLTATAGSDGSITPSGSITVNHGDSRTFTFAPNTGYRISNVSADNVSVGAPAEYTFSNIGGNHSISVTFSLITNTITASAGTGGTISPNGSITAEWGSDQTFNVSANTGYYISDVLVDNESAGAITSYTFENVISSHTISASFSPVTYIISGSAGPGGSINPAGNVTVNHGSSRTFTINSNFGFQVSDVKVDNVSVGAVSTYTFSNITGNHTISATFETAAYPIVTSAGNGGSINPSGTITVTHGTNQTFSITPATGYRISDVKVDNNTVGIVSSYTFSNISSGHTISVTFEILKYTIISSAGTGGSVSSSGNIVVDYGSSRTFTFSANTGYYLSDVLVDNASVGQVSSYTFGNITENHTISAVFKLIEFTLTGNAGAGGSISPAGESVVNYGSSTTYTITPNTGFLISDVKIDNVSTGIITSYTFTSVTSNHIVSATFIPITFNIKGISSDGGSINPSGTIAVVYGTDLVCTITPTAGYQVEDVLVNNNSVGPVTSYTFTNITEEHTISATFSIKKYSITADANTGGSINPHGTTILDYGSDLTFNFTPDYGYRVTDVKVDNISVGTISSYTFSNITDNHNLSVIFKPIIKYTISAIPGTGGSITPSGSVTIFEGSDQTYSITPSYGYRILDVVVDNHSFGALSEYTFSNISSNHNISVTFTTSVDVNVYPNPFIGEFKINIAAPEGHHFDMEITDLSGKIVYSQTKLPGNTIIPVSFQGSRGLYIIRILSGGKKVAVIKIVKS
jgi:hypothetical protein